MMGFILSLLGNKAVLSIALSILEGIIGKQNLSNEEKTLFIKMAQLIRQRMGVDVKSRFESESQVAAGNDVWDQREKEKQNGNTLPK